MASISRFILKRLGIHASPLDQFHENHRNQVHKLLIGLEPTRGKLSSKVIKQCDDYAHEILGDKIYAPWLYLYSAIAGKFKEGWIPDNYYPKVVVPAIQGNYRSLSILKALYHQLFQEKNPLDLIFHVTGLFLDSNLQVIEKDRVKDILFSENDSAIYKIERSGRGLGIYWFHKDTFDINKIEGLQDGVFQSPIKQHPFFSEFTPSSVVTLRLTTVIEDSGKCSLRSSRLKIGRAQDDYIKADNYLAVFYNPENGLLDDVCYFPDWTTSDKHPDTHIPFAGKAVPHFDKCADTVIELHKKIPYVRCLGWDITVDSNNQVQVIEWNAGHNGINLSEAVHGPCFADMGWETLWKNQRISH
ncbi:MAG: sugar-transfer associated ATP-grasp domain-containing protein [Verrucomicrobiota bacterium]